jgi:hypothetical protein
MGCPALRVKRARDIASSLRRTPVHSCLANLAHMATKMDSENPEKTAQNPNMAKIATPRIPQQRSAGVRCRKACNRQEHFDRSGKNSATFSKAATGRQLIWRTN